MLTTKPNEFEVFAFAELAIYFGLVYTRWYKLTSKLKFDSVQWDLLRIES